MSATPNQQKFIQAYYPLPGFGKQILPGILHDQNVIPADDISTAASLDTTTLDEETTTTRPSSSEPSLKGNVCVQICLFFRDL